MVKSADVKTEFATLVARKDIAALRKFLEPWLASDLAPLIADLQVEQLAALFRVCSRDVAAATFTYMAHDDQRKVLRALSQEQVGALLNALPPDDRTAFLNELPLEVAMQLLAMLSPAEREVAESLLAYPEHSVGRLMTLDFVAVRAEWTVGEALAYIRTNGYDRETLSMIYVVDDQGQLIDDVRVRRFLISSLERCGNCSTGILRRWRRPTIGRKRSSSSKNSIALRCP